MPDPRQFDLYMRSFTTGAIALVIVIVAAYEGVTHGDVDQFTSGAALLILGVYFGSHASINGAGVRAARDQEMTRELLAATSPQASTGDPVPPRDG